MEDDYEYQFSNQRAFDRGSEMWAKVGITCYLVAAVGAAWQVGLAVFRQQWLGFILWALVACVDFNNVRGMVEKLERLRARDQAIRDGMLEQFR